MWLRTTGTEQLGCELADSQEIRHPFVMIKARAGLPSGKGPPGAPRRPARAKGSPITRRVRLTVAPFRAWRGSPACVAGGSAVIASTFPRPLPPPHLSGNPWAPRKAGFGSRGPLTPHPARAWRRGRDLNPRHPFGVHLLSRQVVSAARPPLRSRSLQLNPIPLNQTQGWTFSVSGLSEKGPQHKPSQSPHDAGKGRSEHPTHKDGKNLPQVYRGNALHKANPHHRAHNGLG